MDKRRPGLRRGLLMLGLAVAAGAPAAARPLPAGPAAATSRPRPTMLTLPPDRTTTLPPRQPDAARLRELAAQREFRYVEPEAGNDAASAFWARLWRWLSRLLGNDSGSRSTRHIHWEYGIYAIAVAILVFAVLKLLDVDITGAFGRSGGRRQLVYDAEAENIHEVDFPTRIAQAEDTGDFRLATRLGYLEVLKRLTDRGLIDWQPNKTNHTYLAELAAGPLREAFRGATREFEYVWYGELRLNSALYQRARAGQQAVARQLTGGRTASAQSPKIQPA